MTGRIACLLEHESYTFALITSSVVNNWLFTAPCPELRNEEQESITIRAIGVALSRECHVIGRASGDTESLLLQLPRADYDKNGDKTEAIGSGSTVGRVGLFNKFSVEEFRIDVELWSFRHIGICQKVITPLLPAWTRSAVYVPKEVAVSSRLTGGIDCESSCGLVTSKALLDTVDCLDEASPPFVSNVEEMITDVEPLSGCLYDEEDLVLRNLCRDPRNLVLDSTCPQLAPHIVITPPAHNWADLIIMQENVAPPQWPGYLNVFPGKPSLRASLPLVVRECERIGESHAPQPVLIDRPFRSFSLSKFKRTIAKTAVERHTHHHLVPVLHKRLYAFCAWSASLKCSVLRARYDLSHFHPSKHLEKESQWVDPALPILAQARKYLGTTIIDSPTPSVTPHIIINSPPPYDNNPYVQLFNSTQNPQDSGFGMYLTVPSSLVEVVNLPHHESEWEEGEVLSDAPGFSSVSTTPSLLFPIEEEEEGDMSICSSGSAFTLFEDTADQPAQHVGNTDGCVAEDDEDGLPPLDDWYMQIASRTGVMFAT